MVGWRGAVGWCVSAAPHAPFPAAGVQALRGDRPRGLRVVRAACRPPRGHRGCHRPEPGERRAPAPLCRASLFWRLCKARAARTRCEGEGASPSVRFPFTSSQCLWDINIPSSACRAVVEMQPLSLAPARPALGSDVQA